MLPRGNTNSCYANDFIESVLYALIPRLNTADQGLFRAVRQREPLLSNEMKNYHGCHIHDTFWLCLGIPFERLEVSSENLLRPLLVMVWLL